MKYILHLTVLSILLLLFDCLNSGSRQHLKNTNASNEISTSTPRNAQADYLKVGNELMHQEVIDRLKIGLKLDSVIVLLGIPTQRSEPEIWGADGLKHQTYDYSNQGIKLNLVQNPDSSFSVNMITISSPCKFKTSRGIGIDSDYKTVESAYVKYIDRKSISETEIVAGSIYGGIVFKFEKQKVKTIFVGAAAE
jgi:hypothetical protein